MASLLLLGLERVVMFYPLLLLCFKFLLSIQIVKSLLLLAIYSHGYLLFSAKHLFKLDSFKIDC